MYFRIYGLAKRHLDKYLKSNTFQIITTAPISYPLLTEKDIQF